MSWQWIRESPWDLPGSRAAGRQRLCRPAETRYHSSNQLSTLIIPIDHQWFGSVPVL